MSVDSKDIGTGGDSENLELSATDDSSSDSGLNGYGGEILRSLRRIIRALHLYSSKLRKNYDLTVPQLVCLSTIAREENLTSVELSRKVQLSPSTIVGIIDRLEKRKLTERQRSRADRREVTLRATELGRQVAANAPSPLQDSLAIGLEKLPKADQEMISRSLALVVDLMEARHIEVAPILTLEPADFSVSTNRRQTNHTENDGNQ